MQPLREKLNCITVGCAWERLSAQTGADAQAGQAAICNSMHVCRADTPAGCVVGCVAVHPYMIDRGCFPAAELTKAGIRAHFGSFAMPVMPDMCQQPSPHGPYDHDIFKSRSVPACTGLHTLQEHASTFVTPPLAWRCSRDR